MVRKSISSWLNAFSVCVPQTDIRQRLTVALNQEEQPLGGVGLHEKGGRRGREAPDSSTPGDRCHYNLLKCAAVTLRLDHFTL